MTTDKILFVILEIYTVISLWLVSTDNLFGSYLLSNSYICLDYTSDTRNIICCAQ